MQTFLVCSLWKDFCKRRILIVALFWLFANTEARSKIVTWWFLSAGKITAARHADHILSSLIIFFFVWLGLFPTFFLLLFWPIRCWCGWAFSQCYVKQRKAKMVGQIYRRLRECTGISGESVDILTFTTILFAEVFFCKMNSLML